MNLLDLICFIDLGHDHFPALMVGSLFPFFQKNKSNEVPAISKTTLEAINQIANKFLEIRKIENYKVYTIAYDNHPVVLIQVAPQKKLRFSNIIEIQIKKYIHIHLSVEVPAVFWRFKTDNSDTPGPEQADYEFDDDPYPQTLETKSEHAALLEQAKDVGEPLEQDSAFLIPPHLAVKDLQVEEISMGEFDEFLKDTPSNEKKDEPQ